MREFFHGRRRKIGAVTLAIALLFMGGWIRSFVVDDYIAFPFNIQIGDIQRGNWTLDGLAAENESLVLYACVLLPILELEPDPAEVPLASSDSTISNAEPAREEIEPADALSVSSETDGTMDEWTVVGEPVSVESQTINSCCFVAPEPVVTIPFCWMVMPLTLLSAYLLLWNPRQQVSGPPGG